MNEQEFMNKIKQQTENLPIPDSLSPENMKKMLDEKSSDTDTKKQPTQHAKSRKWIPYAAVACAVLFIAGGTGISLLTGNTIKQASDTIMYEDADEAAENESAVAETTDEDSSVYKTAMNTPASYEEYYNTVKKTLDAYYDSFAQVETSDVARDSATNGYSEKSSLTDFAATTNALEEAEDYSTTNTQEETVDEGDIVKTDGNYIYRVTTNIDNGQNTSTLSIIKADKGNMTEESSIDLNQCITTETGAYVYFQEFYLYQDYLVLLFSKNYDTTEIITVIYDIKDKSNPVQKKVLTQSGSYESSRISDGYLYTISVFSNADFSTQEPYSNYIPSVNGELIDCNQIYYPDNILAQSTYVVTSTDLTTMTTTDSVALPTGGGNIYVSDQSIYLYGPVYNEPGKTEFLRIHYEKGNLTPGKSAVITGYVYDNFAINEHNGYLRIIATISPNRINLLRSDDAFMIKAETNDVIEDNMTEDVVTENDTTEVTEEEPEELTEDINVLYIFDENMNLASKLSGIAPGEQVKSVRYIGDMGYLVTYETVDPLFSIDLLNPNQPEILGRLTIPGFSNYLHPYADGLLLGIGEEYTPQDQTFVGLKLSMFDISQPTDIKVAHQHILENGYYSTAQYNHKALMIDTEKNIFGFFYQEQIEEPEYTYTMNNYFVTYQYDAKEGFIETGRYKIDTDVYYDLESIRGLYIGDYLYISTNHSITSYELNGAKQIDSLTDAN